MLVIISSKEFLRDIWDKAEWNTTKNNEQCSFSLGIVYILYIFCFAVILLHKFQTHSVHWLCALTDQPVVSIKIKIDVSSS